MLVRETVGGVFVVVVVVDVQVGGCHGWVGFYLQVSFGMRLSDCVCYLYAAESLSRK